MIRRPPRSTQSRSSAASDVYKRQVPYASTRTTPKNKAFGTAYTDRYHESPGKYSAAGYNAINILAEAITRAGTTDPEKLRDALGKTDYEGPNGHFQFDSKGQASGFSVVLVELLKGIPTVAATSTIEP